MSFPILYSPNETNFEYNGIGVLSDCIKCECTEVANGEFELTIKYKPDGIHFEEIQQRSIVKAKIDRFRNPQLFRVYSITKPFLKSCEILARHISYDLSGIPVSPFSASNANDAMQGLKTNASVPCPFEFWTDIESDATFSVNVPSSTRSMLGGTEGSILDVYGGEYEFDNYNVMLYNNRGEDRGFSVRYGKNLTDLNQEENCSNVYTGIYPYWVDIDGSNLVELDEKIVNAPGDYDFVKIKTLDLSMNFAEQPSQEELRNAAERYISENNIGIPSVSLSVSFVQLDQSLVNIESLDRVSLFDTVNVEFPKMKVSATAKVVKIVYDVILERFKQIVLGRVRKNYTDSVQEKFNELDKKIKKIESST